MTAEDRISDDRIAEIQALLDGYEARDWTGGGYWPFGDVITGLPEFHGDDRRNLAIPDHADEYVLHDGTTIENKGNGWLICRRGAEAQA